MDIIEKIEIKHFRSFDGGKDQEKVKIDHLGDLNVFSGSNDSGKSNVLRSLNLFFNDEISPGVPFDKDRDFSKTVSNRFDAEIKRRKVEEEKRILESNGALKSRGFRRSDEVISIKLFFYNPKKQRGLPVRFWVSKSYSQKNNFQGEYIYPKDLKGNAQVTLFLNSFRYEYVPAIKDKVFFNHLFQKLQTYLFEKEDKKKQNKFSESSKNFNEALTSETKELFEKFRVSSGVDANFYIPSTLVDFFRTLSVQTENNISLFDRGDGVQARFIPEILDEISKGSTKNIIWGFEEPENSYEVKNIRNLRDDFLNKFSRKKQIFITSHTKEFLSLKRVYTSKEQSIIDDNKITKSKKTIALSSLAETQSSSRISIYRIWKNMNTNNTSFVTRFDENNKGWENTCDDLGIIQEARIIDDLQEKLDLQRELIQKSGLKQDQQNLIRDDLIKELEQKLMKTEVIEEKIEEYEKPILVVEDKLDAIYKIAYLKTESIPCTLANFKEVFKSTCPFTIRRAEGAGALAGKLRMNNTDGYDDKKLLGLFDYDKEGSEQFYQLKRGNNWDSNIHGDTQTGLFKKRNQHGCFFAMLLPIPARLSSLVSDIQSGQFESFIEIENLLPMEFLTTNNLATEKTILTSAYLKIDPDSKAKLPTLLIHLDKSEFVDFAPLFKTIKSFFEL